MTINIGETVFFGAARFCRISAAIVLLGIAGCSSTNSSGPVPMADNAGPKDTGTFPNLNIPPKVANKQFTPAETSAKLAELKADENGQGAKRGGGAAVANQAALTDLAKKHGPQTLKQIEGKCDPALDPTCK